MQKRDASRVGRRGVLEGAVGAGAAELTSPMAARSQTAPSLANTSDDLTADEFRGLLDLEPNATCGLCG